MGGEGLAQSVAIETGGMPVPELPLLDAGDTGMLSMVQPIQQLDVERAPMQAALIVTDDMLVTELPFVDTGDTAGFSMVQVMQQLDVVVQPTGVTESVRDSRIFGVHLLASTYLSELNAFSEQIFASTSPDINPEAVDVTGLRSGSSPPMSAEEPMQWTASPECASAEEAFVLLARKTVETMTDETRSPDPGNGLAESSQQAFWSQESLRLTKQADGSLTLWLRDFRMDDNDAARLVNKLVKDSGARQIHLGRVVFNGREAWVSSDFTEKR